MSLTILQAPFYDLLSAGNDNVFTISGDTYGTANVFEYKYIADIYINDLLQCTLKSFPDPTYGIGVFNTRNIINSFMSYDAFFGDVFPLFVGCINSSAKVVVQFGEEYVSGNTFIQSRDLNDSNQAMYINGSLSVPQVDAINLNQYTQESAPAGFQYALTSRSLQGTFLDSIGTGVQITSYPSLQSLIYFVSNKDASPTQNLQMQIYTYADLQLSNQLGQYTYDSGIAPADGNDIMAASVGVSAMNELNAGNATADLGTFPIVTDSVACYVVLIYTFGEGGTYSSLNPVVVIPTVDCGRTAPDALSIQWLNEFGGFDSWLFNKKNETTQTKSVASYKKIPGVLHSTGQFVTGPNQAQQQPFFTELQDSTVMNTDLLTDKDVIFLKGLFSSPVVFMTTMDGTSTAINIQTDSYVIKKKVNQKLYSLQLTANQSYNDYRQIL